MAGLLLKFNGSYRRRMVNPLELFVLGFRRIDWVKVVAIVAGIVWVGGMSVVAYRLVVGSIH
jgi:hypothetical protein